MKKDFSEAHKKKKNKSFSNASVMNANNVDSYSPPALMLKERVIQITGTVNSEMAYHINAQLKSLEYADPDKPIVIFVNSPGGSVSDGLAIFDVMRQIKCRIVTVGNGVQASMGSVIFMGGDERVMMPNAEILCHQILGGTGERLVQHTEFESAAQHMSVSHERLKSIYVGFSGLNHEYWDIVMERDTIFNAEQAIKLGLAHRLREAKKDDADGPYAADTVRKPGKTLYDALKETAVDFIQKMSANELVMKVNNGSAEGGVWARYRSEAVMRLAEFPQFWSKGKKLEMKNKVVTNDNKVKNNELNDFASKM